MYTPWHTYAGQGIPCGWELVLFYLRRPKIEGRLSGTFRKFQSLGEVRKALFTCLFDTEGGVHYKILHTLLELKIARLKLSLLGIRKVVQV